jgi:cellulose synthase/poly-beta-1,6-N-acetylglucosamine synthase-like glycosyltransferase
MLSFLDGLWLAGCSVLLFHLVIVLFRGYKRLSSTVVASQNANPLRATLIVAAKNEAKNLQVSVASWLAQTNILLDVIIVLDDTTDHSRSVLAAYSSQIKIIESTGGKKKALETGIRAANSEYLIFTDADCVPASDQWATYMANALASDYDVVLGYGRYSAESSLLSRVIQYETLTVGADYLASTVVCKPYMAVGRCFAYRKDAFETVGGYEGNRHLVSGDDDLLLQKFVKAGLKIGAIPQVNAHTISKPKATWREWLKQKTRHQSAGRHYHVRTALYLWATGVSRFLLWVLLPFYWASYGASLFTFIGSGTAVVYCFSYSLWGKLLQERYLVWFTPLFEIILLSGKLIASTRSFFTNQTEWN